MPRRSGWSGDSQGRVIWPRWCEKQTSELDWLGEHWGIGNVCSAKCTDSQNGKAQEQGMEEPANRPSQHIATQRRRRRRRKTTQWKRAKLRGGTTADEAVSLSLRFPFCRYKSNTATRLRVSTCYESPPSRAPPHLWVSTSVRQFRLDLCRSFVVVSFVASIASVVVVASARVSTFGRSRLSV